MLELLMVRKKTSIVGPVYTGPNMGIFFGGTAGGVTLKTTNKYFLNDNTVVAGTAMIVERRETSGAGNRSEGFCFCGASSSVTLANVDNYAYASDVVTASSNMTYALWGIVATGNDAMAIVTGGYNTKASQKYSYANRTSSVTTSLDVAMFRHCASSTLQTGFLFKMGTNRGGIRCYTYSNSTLTTAIGLSLTGEGAAAGGTLSHAVVTSGYVGTDWTGTEKYDYAANARSIGTKLSVNRLYLSAAGDKEKCIFGLGSRTGGISLNAAEVYTYSTDAVVPGTALYMTANSSGALSAPPGWVA